MSCDIKKPRGEKLRIHKEKKRREHIYLVGAITILIASILLVSSILNQPSTPQKTDTPAPNPKVAIVDHLSLTRPNQTFIESVTNLFEQGGFTVDYYPGEHVTVECYKYLPVRNYDVILLRVHSAGFSTAGAAELQMFTSEPYSSRKYVRQQLAGQLGIVKYSSASDAAYFGICPNFVEQVMLFRFNGTIIIMMGCDGFTGNQMAEAFIEKGASIYIGWNGSIFGSRNDPAVKHLIQRLVVEKQTVHEAVADTMIEFPPNLMDNSILQYYPRDAES